MSLGYTFLGCPFLLNIDNKEILFEILNYSIDVLIDNSDEQQLEKHCHKYGFQNEHDFMLTTRKIARAYRAYFAQENATEADLLLEFGNLSPELQKLVPAVFEARRPEIVNYMQQLHNAQENPLVQSFDYDVRVVIGDSSYAQNYRELVRVYFNCCDARGKKSELHFEIEPSKLDEFIAELEKALPSPSRPQTVQESTAT